MTLQGYIREIGEPREWAAKDGEKRQTYPITVSLPYVGRDGKEHCDDLIAEHTCANPEYVEKLRDFMQKHQKMEFNIGFQLREWQGKQFNNIRLWNIQILL